MPAPFIVFSLPRSRSTWLGVFLSRPDAICGHDIGPTCDHPGEFIAKLREEVVGTCETGAAFAWKLIRRELPEARFAVIRRDPAEVVRSLERCGVTGQEGEIWGRARDLDRICAEPGTLAIDYADLARPEVCAALYRHCRGEPMPRAWWAALDPVNIQVDMGRQLGMLAARRTQIEALKAAARGALADA